MANISSRGEDPRTSPLVNLSDRSAHSRSIETGADPGVEATVDTEEITGLNTMAVLASYTYESFIGRTWALVVISIALFGVCVSLWMMVSCDWWRAADAHL